MQDLIERLEKATGADDTLNREIAKACGISWSTDEEGNYGPYNITPRRIRFTESVDAALSLMPVVAPKSGFYGDRFVLVANGDRWACVCAFAANVGTWRETSNEGSGNGTTAALAVCIAALRARQAMRPLTDDRQPEEQRE